GYPAADRKRRPRSRFGASMAGAVPANRPGSAAVDAGDDVVVVDADVDAVGTEVPGDRLSRCDRADQPGTALAPDPRHGVLGGGLSDGPGHAFGLATAVAGDGRATAGRLQRLRRCAGSEQQ